ncbi:hemolysin-III family protein [Fusarium bulbicola]|nr:hemolysin-III family protein [Fusarium bulbicola]
MASTPRFRFLNLQTAGPNNAPSESGKAARPVLLSFDQMPKWFRHESNNYVLRGYRDISSSFRDSLYSLSYVHNESVNNYSHLIPAVFFLIGEWYIQQYSKLTGADSIVWSIFMLAAIACLSLSVMYHTFMNHSKSVGHFCLRLDMLGVVIFILGDLVFGIYLVFWCEHLLRNIYWSMMHPKFQGPKYRLFRASTFIATGLFGLLPLIHGTHIFGMSQMTRKALPYTLAKAGCLLLGTSLYVIHTAMYWTYIASASCNTAKWIPQAGQTIELVLQVLGITQQDFEALNPNIDVNNMANCTPYNVPYKERLCLGSWSSGFPHFLQIPLRPSEANYTPTVRQYGTGASDKYKLPTSTVPLVMHGTIATPNSSSRANKDGGPSFISTSPTVDNSKLQTSSLTSERSKSHGKPSSEWYDMIPIETLMTLVRVLSVGNTFDGELGKTTMTTEDATKTSRSGRSRTSTAESFSTETMGVGSKFEELQTQQEHWGTSWHRATAVEPTPHSNSGTTEAQTTVAITQTNTETSTTELRNTNSVVLVTSTVTMVEQQTVTRALLGQTTVPKPICGNEDELQGHAEIRDQRVRQTSFEWCSLPAVKELMNAGDACVLSVQADSGGILYEYSICWADDCIGAKLSFTGTLGKRATTEAWEDKFRLAASYTKYERGLGKAKDIDSEFANGGDSQQQGACTYHLWLCDDFEA